MQAIHDAYEISDDPARIDLQTVQKWLSGSYWSPGISIEKVKRGAQHSAVVVGAYAVDGKQVGYCRAVSDRTRFAWLADVFVDVEHRKHGLARAMVAFLLNHPELVDVEHWLLGTQDAHGVYASLGFGPPRHPERLMQWVKPRPQT